MIRATFGVPAEIKYIFFSIHLEQTMITYCTYSIINL